MAETEPGEVAEVDFGRLGLVYDPESGKKRFVYALVVTLVFSRHQYVAVSLTQEPPRPHLGHGGRVGSSLAASREGSSSTTYRAAVVKSDRYAPVFNRTFLEYSEYRGFIIDPAPAQHGHGKAHRRAAGALREEELLPGGDLPRSRPHPGGGNKMVHGDGGHARPRDDEETSP